VCIYCLKSLFLISYFIGTLNPQPLTPKSTTLMHGMFVGAGQDHRRKNPLQGPCCVARRPKDLPRRAVLSLSLLSLLSLSLSLLSLSLSLSQSGPLSLSLSLSRVRARSLSERSSLSLSRARALSLSLVCVRARALSVCVD
jgi:hypothetical protein